MQRVLRSGGSPWASRWPFEEHCGSLRMKARGLVNSGSSANLVGIAALFYHRSALATRRRSHRAGMWAKTFIAAAVRIEAAIRRRRLET